MKLNSVTLDVSKVTGWLNADADCRVEGHAIGARDVRAGRWGSWGVGQGRAHKRGAHAEEPRLGAGHAPAAERTWNTPFMFVTLDVSKLLTGWLKLFAP